MTEQELREAVDDLWACIDFPEIRNLQPETVKIAKENHLYLWYDGEPDE